MWIIMTQYGGDWWVIWPQCVGLTYAKVLICSFDTHQYKRLTSNPLHAGYFNLPVFAV